MQLGDRLKKLRVNQRLSQQELASRLSMNRITYSQYETNRRQPDYETLLKIADYHGVSVDYLLGRTNEPIPVNSSQPSESSYHEQKKEILKLIGEMTDHILQSSGRIIGLIHPEQIGTISASPLYGQELRWRGSFVREMESCGKKVQSRFIQPSSVVSAGTEIGRKLGIDSDTKVLRRYRIHMAEKVPYRIVDSYYLASLLGELERKDETYIPLFQWLRENKSLRASRVYERLKCRLPFHQEAYLLQIAPIQPVVDLERWVWGVFESGRDAGKEVLFEYSRIIANAALHVFPYSYDIEEEATQ